MLAKVTQTKRLLKTKHHVEMGNNHIFTGTQRDCELVAKACNKSRIVLAGTILPLIEAYRRTPSQDLIDEIGELFNGKL